MSDSDKATLEHDQKMQAQENALTITRFLQDLEYATSTLIPDAAVVLSPDVDALAYLLATLSQAVKRVQDAKTFVEDELTNVMPGRYHDVPGLGRIEMHTGSKRNEWDHEAIVDAAVPRVFVNVMGEGQYVVINDDGQEVDGREFVRSVVDEFRKLGNTNWRTGGGTKPGLRTFGIDPDEYCHVTYGRKTIALPSVELPEESDEQTSHQQGGTDSRAVPGAAEGQGSEQDTSHAEPGVAAEAAGSSAPR